MQSEIDDANILDGEGANTRVDYMYRDADNYKVSGTAILEGRLSAEDATRMRAALDGGMFFIPGQVGLRDLQGDFGHSEGWSEADHVWHELTGLAYTDEPPTAGHDTLHVDTLVEEWPALDGWDAGGHAANLSGI